VLQVGKRRFARLRSGRAAEGGTTG
jgi:hypothetical protein